MISWISGVFLECFVLANLIFTLPERQKGSPLPWILSTLFASVLLAAFAANIFLPHPVQNLESLTFHCYFKSLTHLPCLSCGLTRGFVLVAGGHWQEATRYHLLSVPLFLGFLFYIPLGLFRPELATALVRCMLNRKAIFFILALLFVLWGLKLSGEPRYW